MHQRKKIAAIIVAAGAGTRMNSDVPKQYLKIGGKPMLLKTAAVFRDCGLVDEIIIVINDEFKRETEELLHNEGIPAVLAKGGKQRQDSVYAGLAMLPEDTEYVIIHDAARPYVTCGIIRETINAVIENAAVVCAMPVKDTIRMLDEQKRSSVTLDRSRLYAVQTPQAFDKKLILGAYEKAFGEGFYGTDDAALVERTGTPVHIIPGAYGNIKITTKEDLPMDFTECPIRMGMGFDAHAFADGRKLVLGGVQIPHSRGLAGHSDADVLVHAVMDALLGAAGCGDIGMHFPDNDPQYKGISSLLLLKKVSRLIAQKGFEIGNIDVTVIAQSPKISPYREGMAEAVSRALGIGQDKVNIKGTTTERMGFTGRGEGIAAESVCALYKKTCLPL